MTNDAYALKPGFTVDRFTIDKVIAVGVSTITYQATETRSAGKVLLQELIPGGNLVRSDAGELRHVDEVGSIEQSTEVAQFLADCASTATLNHAGLIKFSRWFKANATAYAVMPWVAGETLASLIEREGKLTAQDTGEIIRPVLEALEYLHVQDLVHQELSPHSIYISANAGARFLGLGGAERNARSVTPYAAVEQSESEFKIGPWTDIYGLAATLYLCITGDEPTTSAQRWQAVQAGAADPLASLEREESEDQSQREISTLIRRGMALEPSSRPQSLREWRARIARTSTDSEQPAPEPFAPYEKEGREWLPMLLLAVFIVAIIGLGLWLLVDRSEVSDGEAVSSATNDLDWTSPEETERWRQALEANAVIGYRTFMEDFPESVHNSQAQEHIDRLEDTAWEAVLAENTRGAFESHLEGFPTGNHATEALAKIEEFDQEEARLEREKAEQLRLDDAAWGTAKTTGTVAALEQYISTWPGGVHIDEARELRTGMQGDINATASFKIAESEHNIEAYRAYIRDFPGGRHVLRAQQSIEDLTLRTGKSFRDCSDCPLMVVVPAGAFWQGSAEASPLAMSIEKPRRRVIIPENIAVSAYEITMAEWDACVADAACEIKPADNGWGRGNRPVILVSWNDAIQYSSWISKKTGQDYTLPSESEWEYFARSGEESDWLGGDAALVCAYANIAGDETNFDWEHSQCSDATPFQTAPAGSHKPNAFGLYDVIGNVAEWTLDCMNLSYLESPTDGSAWSRGMCSSRITRGGSWFTGTKESRLPARFNLRSGDRNDFTGFRLVRRVEKQ
jgi:formylglycine-generating enzyme required for sulfatase activity/serine/threonine protein kinase